MGLGKTLPTLALIAGSLNENGADQNNVKPITLIVVPLSSTFAFSLLLPTLKANRS